MLYYTIILLHNQRIFNRVQHQAEVRAVVVLLQRLNSKTGFKTGFKDRLQGLRMMMMLIKQCQCSNCK
jgi:hypothetical protein